MPELQDNFDPLRTKFRIEIKRIAIGPQHHPDLEGEHIIFRVTLHNGDSIWQEEYRERELVLAFLRGAEAYARLHSQYFIRPDGW